MEKSTVLITIKIKTISLKLDTQNKCVMESLWVNFLILSYTKNIFYISSIAILRQRILFFKMYMFHQTVFE